MPEQGRNERSETKTHPDINNALNSIPHNRNTPILLLRIKNLELRLLLPIIHTAHNHHNANRSKDSNTFDPINLRRETVLGPIGTCYAFASGTEILVET